MASEHYYLGMVANLPEHTLFLGKSGDELALVGFREAERYDTSEAAEADWRRYSETLGDDQRRSMRLVPARIRAV